MPAVLDVPAAAALLGLGRSAAYKLLRTGSWPTPVLRLGRLIKIPTQPLLELLSTGFVGSQPESHALDVLHTRSVRSGGAGGWFPTEPLRAELRRYAQLRHLSVVELARELQIDRRTLQRIVERRMVRSDTADRTSIALGRHPSELWPDWFA
jgi:lambda repressor-like predicted transcriptional regulator